jgi:hypothetical protein
MHLVTGFANNQCYYTDTKPLFSQSQAVPLGVLAETGYLQVGITQKD